MFGRATIRLGIAPHSSSSNTVLLSFVFELVFHSLCCFCFTSLFVDLADVQCHFVLNFRVFFTDLAWHWHCYCLSFLVCQNLSFWILNFIVDLVVLELFHIRCVSPEHSLVRSCDKQVSLANCDGCPTPAKSEGIEYLQVGPTEIRYSVAWTIFVYL